MTNMTKKKPPRPRDSAASRDRLLKAAGELFAERGYDRATARDIGERADVDPTMIARYFGGKAQLYMATLRSREESGHHFGDILEADRLSNIIKRIVDQDQAPGPIFQAALHPHRDKAAQSAASKELERRIVGPLRERLAQQGYTRPALRAEVMAAAFIGVIVGRNTGTFKHLAEATADELVGVLADILGSK
jgi:AcrR family transcriptional regulator